MCYGSVDSPTDGPNITAGVQFQLLTPTNVDPPVFQLTCTSTSSPPTTVQWTINGSPVNGGNYASSQIVTDRGTNLGVGMILAVLLFKIEGKADCYTSPYCTSQPCQSILYISAMPVHIVHLSHASPLAYCTSQPCQSILHISTMPVHIAHLNHASPYCTSQPCQSILYISAMPVHIAHLSHASPYCTSQPCQSIGILHISTMPVHIVHLSHASPYCTSQPCQSILYISAMPVYIVHLSHASPYCTSQPCRWSIRMVYRTVICSLRVYSIVLNIMLHNVYVFVNSCI